MKTLSTITVAFLAAITLSACVGDKNEYVPEREKRLIQEKQKSQDILGSNGCRACHRDQKKHVGPSFAAISKNMQQDGVDVSQDQIQAYAKKIQGGTSGRYGSVKMPPNILISDATAETLIFAIRRIGDEEGGR